MFAMGFPMEHFAMGYVPLNYLECWWPSVGKIEELQNTFNIILKNNTVLLFVKKKDGVFMQ